MKRKQKLSKLVENCAGPHTFLSGSLTGTAAGATVSSSSSSSVVRLEPGCKTGSIILLIVLTGSWCNDANLDSQKVRR